MTVRPCLRWPDLCLRKPALAVEEISEEIRTIWQDMVDTMDAMPGVGLAAPQIGISLQLAVVDASDARNRRILMANPSILEASAIMNHHEEASPNLPGVSAQVTRPRGVTVRFIDETGAYVLRDFVGLEATSVQHQIDHLQGKMYFDRLSRMKRDMLLRKARKARA
ncbi:Peptide deformylase 1 [Roseobacter fucihabitans]|uniref:Peptide deformylase-like n=1 Tax=Roseobacter fucihabitans TaxID=1537242 RepID=A0ABZ2BQ78_9RHOB|nr:peptide deformylase [Roseobacter litoralis]MBC6964621.1 Peptide deformylase 1 [Roseobacter litoralis]